MDMRMLRSLGGCALAVAIMSGPAAAQIALEGIVVTSTKTSEAAIDALSGTSALGRKQLDEQFQSERASDFLRTLPGVDTSETARDTAMAINIRGLQDFGRVNVLIDGARQNFQRSGHQADGVFYIDPEMLKSVDITRGPSATIYGSGAIGGVVAFEVLDADDILKPGEAVGMRLRTRGSTNGDGRAGSAAGAIKVGNFDVLGMVSGHENGNYQDGAGREILNSEREVESKLLKARFRPAPGHQIAGTIIDYQAQFADRFEPPVIIRDTDVTQRQYSLGYTFSRPDVPLVDFNAKIYHTNTHLDQVRRSNKAFRFFDIETEGVDVYNTSRFAFGSTKLGLTYGVDGFQDKVTTRDVASNGDELTPSGERTVYGGFVQGQLTFFDRLDLITALRYDTYEITGNGVELEGSRISPKVTVGYKLVKGVTVYGTYAEGYRAPSITETIIEGIHPSFPFFTLLPNPTLRPEVAHNLEAGVNFKFNGVLTSKDALRARVSVFRNKIDDYIDVDDKTAVPPVFPFPPPGDPGFGTFQYVNRQHVTIEGVELEGIYDARTWFLGLAGSHIRGTDDTTGLPLLNIPAHKIVLTTGFRAFDERLVAGTRVRFVAAQDRVPPGNSAASLVTDNYTVVDLFAQYALNEAMTVNFNIDNLFDQNYRSFLDQSNSPGLNARVGLTMRLGASN